MTTTIEIGSVYHYLKVIAKAKQGWNCLCIACNTLLVKPIRGTELRRGSVKSCGCISKQLRNETHKKTCQKKYGVDSHWHIQQVKDKSRQTLIKKKRGKKYTIKIGDIFGTLCVTQEPQVASRNIVCCCTVCKQTSDHDYVYLLHNKDTVSCRCQTQLLRMSTNVQRYGYAFTSQSPIIQDRIKTTTMARYGVENIFKAPSFKEVHRQHMLENGDSAREFCLKHGIHPYNALRIFKAKGEIAFIDYCDNYKKSTKNTNSLEQAFIALLSDTLPIERYNHRPQEAQAIINRPDFRIELNNKILYVNTDGLFHHSYPRQPNKKYHQEVRQKFADNSLVLFQFRADEVEHKSSIVKSMILNYFGIYCNKYDARKCQIKALSQVEADQFFESNHLMGTYSASTPYALVYNNLVVAIMSIRKRGKAIEIARFASQLNSNVRGGFSKLLNHVIKLYNPQQILSYCDLRYASGNSYLRCGFTHKSTSLGWKWTDGYTTYNRRQCRAKMDSRQLAEAAHAKELGWFKIYDAGQALFVR